MSDLGWLDIKDDLRVEEVMDELGIQVVTVRGFENTAHCPLSGHGGADSNPSFSINVNKGVYNCFSCSSGNMVDLVMDMNNLEYSEAIRWLLQFSDFENQDDEQFMKKILHALDRKPPPREPRHPVMPRFSLRTIEGWVDGETDFYEKRFISEDARAQLKLGYDPAHPYGGFVGPAAIIPHFFRGKLVGYQRRWLTDDRPDWIGKYVMTDDFPKRSTLYNYDIAIQNKHVPIFVVESPLTVARLLSAGYMAVSTFGASSNALQLKLLTSFENLVLAFDNDEAGRNAAERIYYELESYCNIDWIPPPDQAKSDLGDAPDWELEVLMKQVEPAFLQFSGE